MKMLNTNQVVFENVTAKYPRLNQTYKFDTMENKTTPCSPLDDGAAYTLDFEMSNQDAQEFLDKIKEVYKEAAKADTKRQWKPEPTYTPYKEIDGVPQGKAKLKGAYSGEKTRPPVQKDADSNKLPEDFDIGYQKEPRQLIKMKLPKKLQKDILSKPIKLSKAKQQTDRLFA